MPVGGMKLWMVVLTAFSVLSAAIQAQAQALPQSCPINMNFSDGTLLHWQAYTGNNKDGNSTGAIKAIYDSIQPFPNGTIGATALPEYNLPNVSGIQVITRQGTDQFGSFPMIPTINGYAYQYSMLLGSTSISIRQPADLPPGSSNSTANNPGGYVRGISYLINVPPGPPSTPYTVTYAYAMVLENGTHESSQQPMARAIVSTPNGTVSCASPEFFLPTEYGILDTAAAEANGFTLSPVPTPNASPSQQDNGQHKQDVWTKGWTEVNFDLSPYRGQQVTLTFEADNCVPGGHFAYAYFAVRSNCAGLVISGDTLLCRNGTAKYTIPSLDSATYNWSVPPGWIIDSGGNTRTVTITAGPQPGNIVATATNSCTSLTNGLYVDLYKGALPSAIIDPADTTICSGGTAPLHALITSGTDYSWAGPVSFTRAGTDDGAIPAVPYQINVLAAPTQSQEYILTLHNADCPIPVSDTFKVNVVPPLNVNAGNDTLIVADQPLQFQVTSNDPYKDDYHWSPSTGLSNPDIADPIGLYGSGENSIYYQITAVDAFGCSGTTSIKITIAHTLPDIFVPNAFTPGTNSNSIFRPVCMGIASLDYFRVFNRWGQLLYSTTQMGQGWDGRINGRLQENSPYLWIVKGTDYTGKVIAKKGTVMLIR